MDVVSMVISATAMVKIVMSMLALMSVWSWSIILFKAVSIPREARAAARAIKAFIQAADAVDGMKALESNGPSAALSAAKAAVTAGSESDREPETRVRRISMREMQLSVRQQMAELGRSIGFLAATATSAPFIGLFGTVWGIMHAFSALGQSANVTLAMVGPGIAEALVATAMGLFAAIPASLAYNAFSGMLDRLEDDLDGFVPVFMDKPQPGAPDCA